MLHQGFPLWVTYLTTDDKIVARLVVGWSWHSSRQRWMAVTVPIWPAAPDAPGDLEIDVDSERFFEDKLEAIAAVGRHQRGEPLAPEWPVGPLSATQSA